MTQTQELEEVVEHIIKYRDATGLPLFKKFNQQFLISVLDRQKIQSIDRIYPTKEDGFNLLEFVRFFLNVVDHTQIQTLYLTITIIDFFKQISQANNFCQKIKFNHLTNFICRKILDKRTKESDIQTKHIPNLKKIQPQYELKEYLLQPPIVYGTAQDNAFKLSIGTIQIDKTKHESVVTNCYFSPTCDMIFSLDALSDSISIYNTSCDFVKKIKPSSSRLKKNTVILSFAYSQSQGRVGAVLKDFSLIFWDVHENFQYQKSISTASHCQQYQSSIYYLNHFKRWITTDKNGHIYVWNLQIQKPERVIICKNRSRINDLCEVSHLNLVAVVQQNRNDIMETIVKKTMITSKQDNMHQKIVLYNFLKGQPAAVIKSAQDKRIPHTLQYSEAFQIILSAGYEKKINVYQIHPKYFDTSLKGQLLGHQSIITCFTVIGKTPMVASADDRGKVKIWDIRNFKCLQTLDFRDKTIITKMLSLVEVGKIGVLGSRINLIQFDEKLQLQRINNQNQQLQPLYINCKYDSNSLFILTKKDYRAIDMEKGTFKHVFCQFYSMEEEITCFKYFEVLNKFIVGNQKGQIKVYCSQTGKLQSTCHPHTASVIFIQYDQIGKLFISASADSNIFIHRTLSNQVKSFKRINKKEIKDGKGSRQHKLFQKSYEAQLQQQSGVIRQMRNNFNKKDIIGINISLFHGLICIISNDNSFYIWDYEYAKILLQVQFPNPNIQPIAVQFINPYSILLISTSNGMFYAFKLRRTQQLVLCCELIYNHKFEEQVTQIHNHISVKGIDNHISVQDAKVYLGNQNGKIYILDFNDFLKKFKKQPNNQSKLSYNPQRQLKENFNTQIEKKKFTHFIVSETLEENFDKIPIVEIKAHKGAITSLFILEMEEIFLVSGSLDKRVKIWRNENQICDLNINLPLPYQWNLTVTQTHKVKEKIMVALKVIQSIFRKYGNDITIGQSKILRVKKLFQTVMHQNEQIKHITQPQLYQQKIQTKPAKLFQNQFSIRDLHYDEIKQINFREIAGPTLREIQMKKKIDNMQRQWQNNKMNEQRQKEKLLNIIQIKAHKNEEKQQIMSFLEEKKIVDNETKKLMSKYPEISKINQRLNSYLKKSVLDQKDNNVQTNHNINKTSKGKEKIPKVFTPSQSQRKQNKRQLLKTKSFEEYFQEKEVNFKPYETNISAKLMSTSYKKFRKTDKDMAFRQILTEMNNKVRYSRQKKRWTTQENFLSSNSTDIQHIPRRNIPLTSYSSMRVTHRNRGQA